MAAPSELFSRSVLTSAGDFYGGFIVALLAAAIFFRRHPQLPFWRAADLCGPAIALGQAIGRIGCFMAGDDYGRPTPLAWGVAFTDSDAARIGGAPLGVPLHPVQLYESAVCLLLFVFLVRLTRRKRFDGEVSSRIRWPMPSLGSSSSISAATPTAGSCSAGCSRRRSSSPRFWDP